MSNLDSDLNSVIANAVNARIEAQVVEALSGDAVIGRYVSNALNQEIETGSYGRTKTTYLKKALDGAVQEATKNALARVIDEESEAIEAAVRKSLRKSIPGMAEGLVESMKERSTDRYSIKVNLDYYGD